MRTLLITDVFPPRTGGSGRWFHELYGRMPGSDYLIAAGESPNQKEHDDANPMNLRRLPLAIRNRGIRGIRSLREYLRPFRILLALVRSEQIGMVHCARCLPEGILGLGLRLFAGVPYACYAMGEELNSASLSREQTIWARIVLSRSKYVIACSINTAKILTESWNVSEDRICILHPGVDTSKFVPSPRDSTVRSELGWGDRPVILTVGRLQKRKGHDMMIAALVQIRRAHPEVLYAIVGDGEERSALARLVDREGLSDHVHFLGEVGDDQMIRCYQQCDLFALPNREVNRDIEGFGMVLVEAQACGKPVVAGASGGTAETMRQGTTGYVVPCDHPEMLADLVSALLADTNQLAIMGGAARSWALAEFDWSSLATQAQAMFRGE